MEGAQPPRYRGMKEEDWNSAFQRLERNRQPEGHRSPTAQQQAPGGQPSPSLPTRRRAGRDWRGGGGGSRGIGGKPSKRQQQAAGPLRGQREPDSPRRRGRRLPAAGNGRPAPLASTPQPPAASMRRGGGKAAAAHARWPPRAPLPASRPVQPLSFSWRGRRPCPGSPGASCFGTGRRRGKKLPRGSDSPFLPAPGPSAARSWARPRGGTGRERYPPHTPNIVPPAHPLQHRARARQPLRRRSGGAGAGCRRTCAVAGARVSLPPGRAAWGRALARREGETVGGGGLASTGEAFHRGPVGPVL